MSYLSLIPHSSMQSTVYTMENSHPKPNAMSKIKLIKDLNVRHDTIKLLEKNIGETFFDINCSNIFLDYSPRAK